MKENDTTPEEPRERTRKDTRQKKKSAVNIRWALIILAWSFILSMAFRFGTDRALAGVNYPIAFSILGAIILIGILFDILGVATTAADEKPFHGMATKRVRGAKQAIWLIRNADKVSNFCNDVIGDICGIISGSTATIIIARVSITHSVWGVLFPLMVTGLVAAVTIGGKALGKGLAINHANDIVGAVGRFLHIFKR
ncbi:MAG: hypothetical protein RSA70_03450 [Clostridia bacterium]